MSSSADVNSNKDEEDKSKNVLEDINKEQTLVAIPLQQLSVSIETATVVDQTSTTDSLENSNEPSQVVHNLPAKSENAVSTTTDETGDSGGNIGTDSQAVDNSAHTSTVMAGKVIINNLVKENKVVDNSSILDNVIETSVETGDNNCYSMDICSEKVVSDSTNLEADNIASSEDKICDDATAQSDGTMLITMPTEIGEVVGDNMVIDNPAIDSSAHTPSLMGYKISQDKAINDLPVSDNVMIESTVRMEIGEDDSNSIATDIQKLNSIGADIVPNDKIIYYSAPQSDGVTLTTMCIDTGEDVDNNMSIDSQTAKHSNAVISTVRNLEITVNSFKASDVPEDTIVDDSLTKPDKVMVKNMPTDTNESVDSVDINRQALDNSAHTSCIVDNENMVVESDVTFETKMVCYTSEKSDDIMLKPTVSTKKDANTDNRSGRESQLVDNSPETSCIIHHESITNDVKLTTTIPIEIREDVDNNMNLNSETVNNSVNTSNIMDLNTTNSLITSNITSKVRTVNDSSALIMVKTIIPIEKDKSDSIDIDSSTVDSSVDKSTITNNETNINKLEENNTSFENKIVGDSSKIIVAIVKPTIAAEAAEVGSSTGTDTMKLTDSQSAIIDQNIDNKDTKLRFDNTCDEPDTTTVTEQKLLGDTHINETGSVASSITALLPKDEPEIPKVSLNQNSSETEVGLTESSATIVALKVQSVSVDISETNLDPECKQIPATNITTNLLEEKRLAKNNQEQKKKSSTPCDINVPREKVNDESKDLLKDITETAINTSSIIKLNNVEEDYTKPQTTTTIVDEVTIQDAKNLDRPMDIENSISLISADSSPIHIKTSHRLHKPDVMLEIPTQELIDIDDVLDSPNDCRIADSSANNSKIDDIAHISTFNEHNVVTALAVKPISDTNDINLRNVSEEDDSAEEKKSVEVPPAVDDAQPSTSSCKFPDDISDDLPEVSDSLGLLAESRRVQDDDDDDDRVDEDDDFDNDESSSQMPTAEHSEDSNPQHSETDKAKEEQSKTIEEEVEDKISNDSEDLYDTDEGRKNDFDTVEIEEHEFTNQSADVVITEEDIVTHKEEKYSLVEDKKEDIRVPNLESSTADVNMAVNNTSKAINKTDDPVISKENEKKEDGAVTLKETVKESQDESNDDVIEQPNIIPTYDLDSDSEDELTGTDENRKRKESIVSKETSTEKTCEELSAKRTKKSEETTEGSEFTPNECVLNIVDLQETSSDDDGVTTVNIPTGIEVRSNSLPGGNTSEIVKTAEKTVISGVQKVVPQKSVPRLNTGELTIKTSSGSEQTLVIPETQVQTEKAPEPKSNLVYSIDSDEEESKEPIKPIKKKNKCINEFCSSDETIYKMADADTAVYYDAGRKRRPLVCQPCADAVLARKQRLIAGIKDMLPLAQLDMSSTCQYSVEVLDSDSEDEEPLPQEEQIKELIGEDAAKFLEQNLVDMLNDTWKNYCLDDRLKDVQDELYSEIESLEIKRKEIDEMMTECQRMTDKLRTDLYATFEPRIQEEPSLVIIDNPDFQYIGPDVAPFGSKNRIQPKRKLSTNNTTPAKRPAVIPLGYTPLNDPRLKVQENKTTVNSDDDKDVSVVKLSAESPPPDLPPPGELTRPPLRIDMNVYAMKNAFGSWLKGKIIDVMPKNVNYGNFTSYRVQFLHSTKNFCKILPSRCIAYADPPEVRMTIGTRLIALFQGGKSPTYSSGVVAEAPTPVNNFRYLVFYDDGYAQYVKHSHTRLVCECSPLVWDEVHPFSRDFIKEYLLAFPERPMVRLHKGQQFKTEWNGKWLESRVAQVDASLVEVEFIDDGRREWIYRGSTRLAPLFMELKAAERQRPRLLLGSRGRQQPRNDMPYVEYTRAEEQGTNKLLESISNDTVMTLQQRNEELRRQRAVAKKSTTSAAIPPAQSGARLTSDSSDSITSRVVYYTPKKAIKPYKLVPHRCSAQCKRNDVLSLRDLRNYNPLAKPLLSGWERQIVRYKGQKEVMYRAPCGRRLRNMKELHRYLQMTESEMPVDLFDFYYGTHCLAEFQIYKYITSKKDLSHGKENVPVSCVNCYDNTLPEFCSYNTERTPTSGVPLNLDPEFLCGCDCTDDCEDKTKCACWKMTLEGARTIGLEGPNIGYEYKRLPEPLPSGIYECNSRCKCKQTCLNRVAQHPLQLKLQVFKTVNRGWGIRALNDIPKGSFLCVYAGNLLTDATANLDGLNEGDEYLAELDYIEVVEQMKEGYEDDIPEADKILDKKSSDAKKQEDNSNESSSSSSEEDESSSKYDKEDDDFRPGFIGPGVTQFNKHLRKRSRDEDKGGEGKDKDTKDKNGDDDCITISDDEEVREPSRFAAQSGMGGNEFVPKYKSVRSYFGEDEACYIMDAKVQGNIGRYLNHSCSPNVFVQNVFVDTHDPRFPWVAFFALSHIKASTELTWNYNYDVGSVPGKVLYCFCEAPNCRGRLL